MRFITSVFFIIFPFGLFQEVFCQLYPCYKNCEEFCKEEFLKESEEDCFAKRLRNWFDAPKTKEKFLEHEDRKRILVWGYFVDNIIDMMTKGSKEAFFEIHEIEKKEKLPFGTIARMTIKAIGDFKKNRKYVENFNQFCKEEGIAFLGGWSCYVLHIEDCVVYVPRTSFCSADNSCEPYQYQMLSRILYYKWYQFFKKKFGLERFRLRDLKIFPLNPNKSCRDDMTDDDCVLVGKFELFDDVIFIKSNEFTSIVRELFLGALNNDLGAAKSLRDLFLGIWWCGIWDLLGNGNRGNLGVKNIDGAWHFVVFDAEAPALAGSPFVYKDENGASRINPPWKFPDEKKIVGTSSGGIAYILSIVTKKSLRDDLQDAVQQFVTGGDCSCERLVEVLRACF